MLSMCLGFAILVPEPDYMRRFAEVKKLCHHLPRVLHLRMFENLGFMLLYIFFFLMYILYHIQLYTLILHVCVCVFQHSPVTC